MVDMVVSIKAGLLLRERGALFRDGGLQGYLAHTKQHPPRTPM